MKGVASCSASSRREWLVGWVAFEGGTTAFGQAFHSHRPSQTQNGGALSWFRMFIARLLKTFNTRPVMGINTAGAWVINNNITANF